MANDDLEKLQTWWHVEEIFHPSYGRHIRQVQDINTSKSSIPLEIPGDFVGLKIRARNGPGKELAFIEVDINSKGSEITINCDPITEFPQSLEYKPDSNGDLLRHLKLEIEWIDIEPVIRVSKRQPHRLSPIFDLMRPSKDCLIEIPPFVQPEFTLTLPLGWRIAKNKEGITKKIMRIAKNTRISVKNIWIGTKKRTKYADYDKKYIEGNNTLNRSLIKENKNYIKNIDITEGITTKCEERIKDNIKRIKSNINVNKKIIEDNIIQDRGLYLFLEGVKEEKGNNQILTDIDIKMLFKDIGNSKRIYNVLADPVSLNIFHQQIDLNKSYGNDQKIYYNLVYIANLSVKITLISWTATIFAIIGSLVAYGTYQSGLSNSGTGCGILVLLLSFTWYYITLYRDGYGIPLIKWSTAMIILTALCALFIILHQPSAI